MTLNFRYLCKTWTNASQKLIYSIKILLFMTRPGTGRKYESVPELDPEPEDDLSQF